MTVKTNCGLVEGVSYDGYTLYKGIPYAKPPIGDLRWKAPVPVEPWEGTYQATTFGCKCPQDEPSGDTPWGGFFYKEFYSEPEYNVEQSEDCLYLNIWTPDNTEGQKLPVAFWIHGGGFSGGYSSEKEFDGEAYCKKGVILVTINYRVNIFGFFAHPWLDAENERGISGNYGSLDQICALKWVKDNIEAFGGDPENITIFGQSAGCMSTQVLMSSPLTGDIPKRAIYQSGVSVESDFLFTPTLKEEEEVCQIFVDLTGAKSIEELRALTTAQVKEYASQFAAKAFQLGKGLCLVPNADGYLLNKTVREICRAGEFKKVPYMMGCNLDDLGSTPEEIASKTPGMLYKEDIAYATKCKEVGVPAYVYYMPYMQNDEGGKRVPTFHSGELWYMFSTLDRSWRPKDAHDYELRDEMVTYWTNFMKTGNPNGEGVSQWNVFSEEGDIKVFE